MPIDFPNQPSNDKCNNNYWLFDTGASISVISATKVKPDFKLVTWQEGPIRMVDGTLINAAGTLKGSFTIGNKQFTHQFVVLPECDFAMILGMDFMKVAGMMMNLQNMTFTFSSSDTDESFSL